MKSLIPFFILAFAGIQLRAQDTFSICAVDTITGEVGSAGASCIDNTQIAGGAIVISDVHPGVGVIHTQSFYISTNQDYGRTLMSMGLPPEQIIDSLLINDAQGDSTARQYGIVDLVGGGRSAAYTGPNCFNYKSHITAPTYAIQGNILLGQQILDSMEARFNNTQGTLACRLMAALQGANVPGADTRCLSAGISSKSAFLRVAKPGDAVSSLYLYLNVPSVVAGRDPIDSLQTLFDNWGGCAMNSIKENFPQTVSVKVFPNPFNTSAQFIIKSDTKLQQLSVIIYNLLGEEVQRYEAENTQQFTIERGKLESGMYFYRVISGGKQAASGKLVID